jgi:dipeptidyl aminopeptidase/acylaminoacyl peptidase
MEKFMRGLLAFLVFSTVSAPAIAQDVTQKLPTEIKGVDQKKLPVEAFANLPFVDEALISPDGTHIAGLFGIGGEQRIMILGLFGDQEKNFAMPVPEGTQVNWVRWVNDDNILVGVRGLLPIGSDRWYISRILSINRTSQKVTKLLWNLAGQNTSDVLWIPSDGSNEILVAAQASIYSNTDEFWPSVYRVDVLTGKKRTDVSGKAGFMNWGADNQGNVRIGVSYDDNSRMSRMLYRSDGSSSFEQVDKVNLKNDESLNIPFIFLPGGKRGLVMRDNDAGKTGVVEMDLTTQEVIRTVYQPEIGEVSSAIVSYDESKLLGVYNTDQKTPVHWLDPDMAAIQSDLDKSVKGATVRIESYNRDQSKMIVRISSPENPGLLYVYNQQSGALSKLAAVNSVIGNTKLAPVKLINYKARDGLDIEGILTVPKGSNVKNLPFIVMPHGGPWAQDRMEYDYWTQFLASRGYAVLQPNFRGSTGYGTEFLKKGQGQMGFAMQDDVTDGVKWAVDQGIADPKRVCIVGASYGGYAAMWGIAKDPDIYRCAISIAGVAALRREVNDFGGSLKANLYKDQWKAMTPDFAAVSPINAITKIKAPLLLIHGKKDVTVDHVQSEKMYNAMKKANKTVEFVSIPLADHYYTRQEDRLTLLKSMEAFLAKYNPSE